MVAGRTRDLDVVGVAKPFLESSQDCRDWFGDPNPDSWISSQNEPPYPRLVMLDTPGGSSRDRRLWLIAPELSLKLLADFDGTPGKKALRDGLALVVDELMQLPKSQFAPGQPVVTDVLVTADIGYLPEPTGQMAYTARLQLFMHPAGA